MITVVIADDHHLVRDGIQALLATDPEIDVIGAAADGTAALAMLAELRPDVAVLDLTMPGASGLQVVERLAELSPGTAAVVLSMHADRAIVSQAMRSGARAYVVKDSVTEELLTAIRAANRGAIYLSPTVSSTTLFSGPPSAPAPRAQTVELTQREHEVLQLVAEGLTNRAIGSRLSISVKTVERHRTSLMGKLDAHSVVELVRAALRHGLIQLDAADR